MDHFVSMYIDDELSLAEKLLFINHVYGNKTFKDDAVAMIEQEKKLFAALIQPVPESIVPPSNAHGSVRSLGLALAACVLLIVSFLAGANLTSLNGLPSTDVSVIPTTVQHRFVLYQQGPSLVEISGSFTSWQKLSLTPTGSQGYWEITLDIPTGEHRYSFIVDGTTFLPDPTVAATEPDDFGAINSILHVEG